MQQREPFIPSKEEETRGGGTVSYEMQSPVKVKIRDELTIHLADFKICEPKQITTESGSGLVGQKKWIIHRYANGKIKAKRVD